MRHEGTAHFGEGENDKSIRGRLRKVAEASSS